MDRLQLTFARCSHEPTVKFLSRTNPYPPNETIAHLNNWTAPNYYDTPPWTNGDRMAGTPCRTIVPLTERGREGQTAGFLWPIFDEETSAHISVARLNERWTLLNISGVPSIGNRERLMEWDYGDTTRAYTTRCGTGAGWSIGLICVHMERRSSRDARVDSVVSQINPCEGNVAIFSMAISASG